MARTKKSWFHAQAACKPACATAASESQHTQVTSEARRHKVISLNGIEGGGSVSWACVRARACTWMYVYSQTRDREKDSEGEKKA
jgi:hypothetical protein